MTTTTTNGNGAAAPAKIVPVRPATPVQDVTGTGAGTLRRTFGRGNASRRTFGRGNASRRTFGRYVP